MQTVHILKILHNFEYNSTCDLQISEMDDLALARQLQAQFDAEAAAGDNDDIAVIHVPPPSHSSTSSHKSISNEEKEEMSLIDPRWETIDPIPDVRALFVEFNDKYFWGRLASVEVRWSPRMTL